ncbi:unnamed protein product [Amaranthus hypochondriacus]
MGDSYKKAKEKHFVLVHGACHGAWCWYKVKPLLEAAGHHVTVLDMGASGINHKKINDLKTIHDYSEPLIEFMTSLPDDQKVILVGHSLGGLNLAVVMDMFPYKIEVSIFLTAFLPDTDHTFSFIFDQFVGFIPEGEKDNYWLDTETKSMGDPKKDPTTILMGPQFLSKLYHLSPPQDYELAMILRRPSSFFLHDLWKPETKFTKKNYGSVRRVYVMCDEDRASPQAFQRWMIKNGGVKEVKQLKGSDHMPMFSIPNQLSNCLLEIAMN